jgi:phosphatidylinositol alpha-1,6-mannosyltransferase
MRRGDNPEPVAMLVTRNFPPLLGGMEKVNAHLLDALRPEFKTALCGPAGCSAFVGADTVVRESKIKPLPLFLIKVFWRACRLGIRLRPQWVFAGSGLTAPMVWFSGRCAGAKTAVYLHGLDIVAPSSIYQKFWLPFIRHCDVVLVNSNHTAELAAAHGISPQRIHVLNPGTGLPMLDPSVALAFREKHEFMRRPLLLSVGRLTRRKGLAEFVENAFQAVLLKHPEALLVIAGDEALDALHGSNGYEQNRILAAARRLGLESSLRFLGRCEDATLDAACQAANVHVFPVLELRGDVEGFGMVALESAAYGLPTVGFAVGGVPDAVSNEYTGVLVQPGDYTALSDAINKQLDRPRTDEVIEACRRFAATKAWPAFGERLRKLLESEHG